MAEETTTTTTTAEPTTTTTTQAPLSADEIKLDNAPTETVTPGAQETASASVTVVNDHLASNVQSKTTNDFEQSQDEIIADAQALALENHANEHANDPTPTTGDKTVV